MHVVSAQAEIRHTRFPHLLRAIIFDFDGVIVDSEPLIMRLTQEMAALEGWTLAPENYYRDYLALDDRGIVERLYRTHGMAVNPRRRAELLAWKASAYREAIRGGGVQPIAGAAEFVKRCALRYLLAIASGSLREEVETLLARLGLREKFSVLATAEDCERSKPDRAIYDTAFMRLQALDGAGTRPLERSECLAIEDAPAGIEAAHAAGLRCMALAHSRPAEELREAECVFSGFSETRLEDLQKAWG
ncbi:MAG: HAD family hydrolase [Terriglobia bacterium]